MINFGIKYIYAIFFQAILTQSKLRRCCWIISSDGSFLMKSTNQRSEEYVGGVSCGANEQGQLRNGSCICFTIIGLKSNVPYVIRSVPETNIKGEWLHGEILNCIYASQSIGFNVRGVVCDNHPSNVLAS